MPVIKTKAVAVGDKAPNFSAADETGRTWSLKALKGKTVILYFYPKDNTSGCTTEACDFRDHYDAFVKKGARILGVSPDCPERARCCRSCASYMPNAARGVGLCALAGVLKVVLTLAAEKLAPGLGHQWVDYPLIALLVVGMLVMMSGLGEGPK